MNAADGHTKSGRALDSIEGTVESTIKVFG